MITAEQIAEKHQAEKGQRYPNGLKLACYRKHYHTIKTAVEDFEVPLRSAIRHIVDEEPEAFENRTVEAVWSAYYRVGVGAKVEVRDDA